MEIIDQLGSYPPDVCVRPYGVDDWMINDVEQLVD
jgi:hypothetical protein